MITVAIHSCLLFEFHYLEKQLEATFVTLMLCLGHHLSVQSSCLGIILTLSFNISLDFQSELCRSGFHQISWIIYHPSLAFYMSHPSPSLDLLNIVYPIQKNIRITTLRSD